MAIERGPLLYALKMNERWERHKVAEKEQITYGKYYYEVYSDSVWNYCLFKQDLRNLEQNSIVTVDKDVVPYPWNLDNAPIIITIPAHLLPRWQQSGGSVGPANYYINTSDRRDTDKEQHMVELIPYGCTTLRIALFPAR